MFPLRDNNPSPRFPIVVLLLIAANVLVFWHEFFTLGSAGLDAFVMTYGMVPLRDFTQSFSLFPYFSSMFLHGGIFHILSNMWFLWIFGDNVEGEMGVFKFLLFYLACGLAAALTHAGLNATSTIPVVGASGAVSGVMGAYLLLFPKARVRTFTLLVFYPLFFDLPAIVFLVIWFGGQLMSASATLTQAQSGVAEGGGMAFAAHVGGFVAGMIFMPLFRDSRRRKARLRP